MLIFNLLPIMLGSAAEAFALDNQQVGLLGFFYLSGFALANVSQIGWVRRVNWRTGVVVGALLVTSAVAGGSLAEDFGRLGACLFLAGCGAGSLFGITVTLFGDTSQPDRYYGFKFGGELLINVFIVLLISVFILERFGLRGVMLTAASAIALLCLPAFRLPVGGVKGRSDNLASPVKASSGSKELWLALAALLVFFGAFSGLWAFVERVGVVKGFARAEIGLGVSLTLASTGLGGISAGVLGDHFGRTAPMLGGWLGFVAAAVLMVRADAFPAYLVGMCLYGFVWQFVMTYMMGLVAIADSDGRFTVLNSAVLGVGGAIGLLIAAAVSRNGDFTPMFLMAGAATTFAVGLSIYVNRAARFQ